MRRPALPPCKRLPGGVRQHRPSVTTDGTCECTNARPKSTAHVQRSEVSPRRARSPINRRGGAPRGERPPDAQTAKAKVCEGMRGPAPLVRSITGAAAPKRLSALRSLFAEEGNWQSSEGTMPRENDEACADARSPHGAKRNAGQSGQSAPDFASLHSGYSSK